MKTTLALVACVALAGAFAPVRHAAPARFALRAEGDESQGSFRYSDSDTISPLEKKKAIEDTSKWCLERCISLGHCEVFEDLAKMSTSQVQDFCKACVIGEVQGADECDVQWMFAEDAPWGSEDMPSDLKGFSP